MAARWGNAGSSAGSAIQRGFFARTAACLKILLGLERVRSAPEQVQEAALPNGDRSAHVAPSYRIASFCQDNGPEFSHSARLTVEQLDACIEESIRCGTVDLQAGRLALHRKANAETASSASPRRAEPRRSAAAKPESSSRRFGGDLYPTAAHRVGRHVREVRDSTWTRPVT